MRNAWLALAFLAAALPALGQCPEPSALDVDPGVPPLRVEKAGGGDLRITWEPVLADGYRLHRGRLDRLFDQQAYDHRVVAETTGGEAVIEEGTKPWYFVVNSDCRASDSGVGRDSEGVERPYGGLVVVTVGLQGGQGVYGAQFNVEYPVGVAFADEDSWVWVGPFDPAAPGRPLGVTNANMPGVIRGAVIFGQFSPDPSFDPPPDMPVDVAVVTFGYHGTPPAAGDFSITGCAATDMLGALIPETECLLSSFDVLF